MIAWLALLFVPSVPVELNAYLNKADSSFGWKAKRPVAEHTTELELTSQTWQGHVWKHSLTITYPAQVSSPDSAILYITGDRVGDKDLTFVKKFADAAKLPVVTLFDVPNQPLYDAREDALIAITFGKYLETKDATWPLLFPMTKAAIRAMDVAQAHSKDKIKRFVVCGASKRGWTTWLVGASRDKRVIGIAPMVIDILNFPKQLARQKAMWGDYSPEIRDYVNTGLVQIMVTSDGQQLIKMVDPYSYLSQITVPTLVITGGNDRYWTVDAHRLYWNEIRGPKLMRVVPNAGHNLNGGAEAAASIAYFAGCLTGRISGGLPRVPSSSLKAEQDEMRRNTPHFVLTQAWSAESDTLNFADSKWHSWTQKVINPRINEASFTEYQYEAHGLKASFTSTVGVRMKEDR